MSPSLHLCTKVTFYNMLPRKSMAGTHGRSLAVTSPQIPKSRGQPIRNTFRYPPTQKPELQEHETASCLEVFSLGNIENHQTTSNNKTLAEEPEEDYQFISADVLHVSEAILEEHLKDIEYDSESCKLLSQTLSVAILDAIKRPGFPKYKLVAIVSIGSLKERPGMQFGSRCLWNTRTDNFISAKFNNESIFAVAMVYGLYSG